MTHIPFEIVPHTADLRIRVYGANQQELFIHAVQGMFEEIEPIKKMPEKRVHHEVVVESPNEAYLLIAFLSECLSLSDIYNEVYDSVEFIELTEKKAHALIKGYSINGFKGPEIKAVTYHDIFFQKKQGQWQAVITFDI